MMNDIPGLKNDFAFLKKFDSRVNAWMEIGEKKKNIGKDKVKSNFLLHPKRLNSDSECSSSVVTSPRKFYSTTVIKNSSLDESNSSITKRFTYDMSYTETRIINQDTEIRLDGQLEKVKNVKCANKTKLPAEPTESSNDNISVAKKSQKIRPNSSVCKIENFEKKFAPLVEKTIKLQNKIRQMLEKGVGLPDGEEDFTRRLKRLQEFSSRFSRNYLYPLGRQIDELNSSDKLTPQAINQKMLYAQQVILNALQSYYNYLPSSVGKCCSDKLKPLLEHTLSLCHVYNKLQEKKTETHEFVKVMCSQTELLIETLATFDLKIIEKSQNICEPKKAPVKKKSISQNDRKKSKLSMYAVSASFRRDLEWKKAVEALAKKKFNVKSRYKTSYFKHRPPVEKPHIVQVPSKVKLFQKRSSNSLKSPAIKSPIREDEITTMVQETQELVAPPNSGKILNHENNIASGGRLVRESNRDIEFEDGNVKKALEVLKKLLGESAQDQARFLEKIVKEMERNEKAPENNITNQPKKKLDPIVTVTGAKNAKLICIRDDNSVIETEDEEKKDKEATGVDVQLVSSETQTDLLDKNRVKSKSTIKISRLPKTSKKVLKLLPKEYAINIIQYKLRYAYFHKQNPLYRKSASVQPWILMGRISDDILDHVLRSVAGELEVNEILENLYNAEFQY